MSVFVGDIGVQLKLDADIDISDQTTLQIKYLKPDSTVGFWEATVSETNFAVYSTVSGDLNIPGIYIVQIYIVTPSYTAHGKKANMFVESIIS